jgi:hypothetical protein
MDGGSRRDLQAIADTWPGPWFMPPVLALFALSAAASTFRNVLDADSAGVLVVNLVLCVLCLLATLAAGIVTRAKWLTRCRWR